MTFKTTLLLTFRQTTSLGKTSNLSYHNLVTSQNSMSHVQFVIGILLISAKQKP